jgi:hypothetical protein
VLGIAEGFVYTLAVDADEFAAILNVKRGGGCNGLRRGEQRHDRRLHMPSQRRVGFISLFAGRRQGFLSIRQQKLKPQDGLDRITGLAVQ